ncbi:outer membrane protein [Mycobacterium saskatchewanense]|uniref:Outer membrane protein n=2 Tax=Mycobacterium saskatchewanense TaxID=220927 RepID=A0AAJ3TXK9_9MYCO|nr:hypothetical protein AWC23_06440 [Mycobacterium saskatchewanense]BBX65179.1 outer membrane protein [Mycobacterium saskatchewanense]
MAEACDEVQPETQTAVDGDESVDVPDDQAGRARRIRWSRVCAYGILPALALAIGGSAGYLKWFDFSIHQSERASAESVRAARDGTIAMLSYRPDSAEKDLGTAVDRMTGQFKNSYITLTHDVVIPGAKQKEISAVATVPAAAAMSANPTHATVLVLVDQTITIGASAPTTTASSVKVTLDKVADRWLISGFDPV